MNCKQCGKTMETDDILCQECKHKEELNFAKAENAIDTGSAKQPSKIIAFGAVAVLIIAAVLFLTLGKGIGKRSSIADSPVATESAAPTPTPAPPQPTVNPADIIATVNGVNILKSQFTEQFEQAMNYYEQNYGDPTADQAKQTLASWKTQILATLISEEVARQKAEKAGFLNYSDADKAKAKSTVDLEREEAILSSETNLKQTMSGQTLTDKQTGETDEQ